MLVSAMQTVLLLLANGFETSEASAFVDVFGWATTFGSEPIRAITAAFHPTLTSTFGQRWLPELVLEPEHRQLDRYDALAIPGGFESAGFYQDAYADAFLSIIRRFDETDRPIAAICVGALPLAKSGALTGRTATTYPLLEGLRRRQLAEMGARVVDAPVVTDGKIVTSTGPATGFEVALTLVELLTSAANAAEIRRLMGIPAAAERA